MSIILILIAAILVWTVSGKLMKTLDTTTQQEICSANIILANKAVNKEIAWSLDEFAKTSVKDPLCTTKINRIDLTKYEGIELDKQVAIEIGEMTENCWKTFGEGKYPNTFIQDSSNWGFTDFNNYYFTCYKFKIHTKDPNYKITTAKLLEYSSNPNDGLLWKYNINKKPIEISFEESYNKAIAGDKNYISYAGYIFYNGYGYLEFMNTTKEKLTFGTGDTRDSFKLTQWLHLDGGIDFIKKATPNMGTPLIEINAERYYEVRYYSPYIKDIDKYKDTYVLNNIKVVPVGEDGAGNVITGAGTV